MTSIHLGQQLAQEYVKKIDEFPIRCNALNTEGQSQILSRFRDRLRDDLRTELLAREITKLEKAYTLVQDLDAATHKQPNPTRVRNRTASKAKHLPTHKADTKGKLSKTKAKSLTESSLN